LPTAPNAIARLSGDQKGSSASSVPGSGRASSESSERSHSGRFPSDVRPLKTSMRPFGETTM
jgi:hypothetical protein